MTSLISKLEAKRDGVVYEIFVYPVQPNYDKSLDIEIINKTRQLLQDINAKLLEYSTEDIPASTTAVQELKARLEAETGDTWEVEEAIADNGFSFSYYYTATHVPTGMEFTTPWMDYEDKDELIDDAEKFIISRYNIAVTPAEENISKIKHVKDIIHTLHNTASSEDWTKIRSAINDLHNAADWILDNR